MSSYFDRNFPEWTDLGSSRNELKVSLIFTKIHYSLHTFKLKDKMNIFQEGRAKETKVMVDYILDHPWVQHLFLLTLFRALVLSKHLKLRKK